MPYKKLLLIAFLILLGFSCSSDDDDAVPKTYNLKISITPGDGGTVSRSIYGPIVEGTSVQLQANPSTNYRLKEWQGDVTETNYSITIEMNSDKTITCVFDSYDPKKLFYLDENGVTVKCQDWGAPGLTGELNGIIYTVVDRERLMEMISREEDVTKVCTSKITDMSNVCVGPKCDQDISSWDVSNVTNMSQMFFQAFSFDHDISYWDVRKVTDMSSMFFECFAFNQDIGSWDVSNVTSMNNMFRGSYSFNQDIGSWNVSNVTDMQYLFIASPFNQDISSWDVSNVTDMEYMFASSEFNQDLSGWNVNNVTRCEGFSDDTAQWILPKPDFTNCDP